MNYFLGFSKKHFEFNYRFIANLQFIKETLSSMYTFRLLLVCFLLIILSCDSGDHIRTYRLPKINMIPDKQDAVTSRNENLKLSWEKPESWIETSGHAMRLVSFNVPFSNGIGDFSMTTFEGSSGGVEANVNRWRQQIGLEPLNGSEIKQSSVSRDGKLGKYEFFKLVNEKNPDSAILSAIFHLETSTLFVKLTIDSNGIEETENDFITFCKSIHLIEGDL